ncbi:MAG: lamin tail domain-containing protein [Flavobacteriales bacterium]
MRRSLPAAFLLLATTANAQLVINEVDYDQPGTDSAEFLELKNTGSTAYPMGNVSVVLVNGSSGTPSVYASITSPDWPALAGGGYFTLCPSGCDARLQAASNAIQNGPSDAIALLDLSDSTIIDVLAYEGDVAGYMEGHGTTIGDDNVSVGRSLGRWPDGADTDDNAADFALMCITPGAANQANTTECDTPTGINTLEQGPGLTVFADPGNDLLWMLAERTGAGAIVFEVFALDGSLLARRTVDKGGKASWAWSTNGAHGRVYLVRATTGTSSLTRRIVMP